jgi:membrane associated rhomboid family serine protease
LEYYFNRFRRFLNNGFTPVTKSLALLAGLVSLLSYILHWIHIENIINLLILNPFDFTRFPWTLVTFPLVNSDLLNLLFSVLWLWMAGGSLERSWGSITYGFFVLLVILVTGIAMAFVGRILTIPFTVEGLWLPLVGITWAWAALYPDREILFFGIIPLKAIWLAWIDIALTFFSFLKVHPYFGPLVGLASLSGIAVVYLFIGKSPFSRGYGRGASTHGFSLRQWLANRHRKAQKSKFKVIK